MEELQNIMNIIHDEKENIKYINYVNICSNLKKMEEKIYKQYDNKIMKELNLKYEKIIKKKMNEMKKKLTNEDYGYIIKEFCNKTGLRYEKRYCEDITIFQEKLEEDMDLFEPTIKNVFLREFKEFYYNQKEALLERRINMMNERIETIRNKK